MSISIPYSLQDIYDGEQRKLFSVVSTFAGGGGSSTGYRLAGGEILAINEFIPSAVDTYKENYPNTFVFPQDIRRLTGKRICKKLGIQPGDLDILDGSPPCASFSMSGNREKSWGKEKKYSDTVQRVDDLFFEFVRLLSEVKPKVFICENVKGLSFGIAKGVLGSTNPNLGLIKKSTILEELQKVGYKVKWKVLNSANYGVPQKRERLIIIGVRNDLNMIPTFPRRTVSKWITLKEAFKGVDEEAEKFEMNLENARESWQLKCKPGQNVSEIHPKGHFFNFGRWDGDDLAPTLMQGVAGKYHLHYNGERYPNIIEGKRVMGFPDDYKLQGTLQQKWERLGRAVPPLMMKAIADHIYKTILSKI